MRLVTNDKQRYNNDNLIEVAKYDEIPEITTNIYIKTQKERDKLIKHIESVIRASIEYKEYIKYIKDFMAKDTFFGKVEQTGYSKVKIEMHHSPFTLYDLVSVVMLKHEEESGKIDIFDIADEVMELHYKCQVGLVPLSKTTHKLVHDGKVFITIKMVRGDWLSMFKGYEKYFPQDMIDKLKRIISYSKEVQDLSLLETKYTYVEVDGFKQIKLLHEDGVEEDKE